MKKKLNWKLSIAIFAIALPMISLVKYSMYELSGAAPHLRNSIGKGVIIPQQKYTVNGKTITSDPDEGTLEKVSYRWNGKIGFFDLYIKYSGGGTGLSPLNAMKVRIIEPQQSSGGDSLKVAPQE